MHAFGLTVLLLLAQVTGAETEIEAEPVDDLGAAYVEEALRKSAARARDLAEQQDVEWPELTRRMAPSLSSETQSRWILERMATAKEPAVRLRALEGWVAAMSWDTPDVLIAGLMDPHGDVSAYAAMQLSRLGREQAEVARLLHRYYIERMLSENARLRVGIQHALPELRPVLEEPMLTTLQSHTKAAPQRAAAAFCLGEMGSIKAIGVLSRTAWAEEAGLARASAEALLKLRHPRSVSTWLKLLRHKQFPIRMAAVDALSTLGGGAAAAALVEITQSTARGEADLRLSATRALARWPVYDSIPLLISALEGQPGVLRIAHNILQQRSGRKMLPDPVEWQRWWRDYGRFGVIGPEEEARRVRPKPIFDFEIWDAETPPMEEGDEEKKE